MSSKTELAKRDTPSIPNEKLKKIQGVKKHLSSFSGNTVNANLEMAKDLQNIIKNCSNLTGKETWGYCKSQRYFMKLYLQHLNCE
ncbi:MAG: hypothetical protein ACQERB_13115 [Promethearchaeati archaeon]